MSNRKIFIFGHKSRQNHSNYCQFRTLFG